MADMRMVNRDDNRSSLALRLRDLARREARQTRNARTTARRREREWACRWAPHLGAVRGWILARLARTDQTSNAKPYARCDHLYYRAVSDPAARNERTWARRSGMHVRRQSWAFQVCAPAAVAVFTLAGCAGGHSAAVGASIGAVGVTVFPARERVQLPAVSGELVGGGNFKLAADRRHVLVLNFWGSWCSICQQEARALSAAARQFQRSGVRFIGIDVADSPASAVAYMHRYKISYPEPERSGQSHRRAVPSPDSRSGLPEHPCCGAGRQNRRPRDRRYYPPGPAAPDKSCTLAGRFWAHTDQDDRHCSRSEANPPVEKPAA